MRIRLHGLPGSATPDLLARDRLRSVSLPLVVEVCAGPLRPPDIRACCIPGSGPGQHAGKYQCFAGDRYNGESAGACCDVLHPDLRQALTRIGNDIPHNRRRLRQADHDISRNADRGKRTQQSCQADLVHGLRSSEGKLSPGSQLHSG